MKFIHFLTQGIVLKRKNNQLVVYENDKKIRAYPLSFFDVIYVYGNVQISPSLMNFLLDNNKFIAFFDKKGRYKGITIGKNKFSNEKNRIKQYEIYFSEEKRLSFSKYLILEKTNRIEKVFSLDLSKYKEKINQANSLTSLLGLEGVVSNQMFNEFRILLKEIGLAFKKREYNPPPDKINSLLSSFYMLYYNFLIPFSIANGFDPFLGIFHIKRGTHHAFVSDLMEVIRPDITYLVYEFLKENPLNEIPFNEDENNCFLSAEGLRKIIEWVHLNEYEILINEPVDFVKNIEINLL